MPTSQAQDLEAKVHQTPSPNGVPVPDKTACQAADPLDAQTESFDPARSGSSDAF